MGVILDSSVLIAGERGRESVEQLLDRIGSTLGDDDCALSAVTVVEMTHGIFRAKNTSDRDRRQVFCETLFSAAIVYPVSFNIALFAGRVEGEQAAKGYVIDTADLLIGVTALLLGFDLATLNVRHFRRIPDLNVIPI